MKLFALLSGPLLILAILTKVALSKERSYELKHYRPMYFLAGDQNSKIQLSFKYKLLKRADFYFGYTQRMFWDFYTKPSSPMKDINYQPEFFYSFEQENSQHARQRLGVGHKSNGEGGTNSRMYNRMFVEALWDNFLFEDDEVLFGFQHFFDEDYYNPDISRYVGPFYADFTFKLGYGFFRHFFYRFQPGSNIDYSTHVYGMNFKIFDNESSLKLFVQYFDGYGETLIDYSRREQILRGGFIIGY
ncbi:MAG: phospholipase A [Bacteriovoracaceae bacterium]